MEDNEEYWSFIRNLIAEAERPATRPAVKSATPRAHPLRDASGSFAQHSNVISVRTRRDGLAVYQLAQAVGW